MSPGISNRKESEKDKDHARRSFKCSCASIFIVLAMICSAVAVIGFADSSDATGGSEGGIVWELSADGQTMTFTPRDGHEHPGVMNDYYSDYDRAPWADCGATNLVLEEGVKQIGTYAFYGMHLTSISLPDSLERIRNSAFEECDQLTTITIPNNVVLESELFEGCDSLSSILFKGNIKFDEQAQNTFARTPSLHVVYHNKDVSLHLDNWPDEDIVFIDINEGTITGAPVVESDDPRFPDISSVYTPPGGSFKAYKIGDTYYGVGDYMPAGKVKAKVWYDDIDSFKVGVLFLSTRGTSTDPQSFDCGDLATEPSPPTADGYVFNKWCLMPDGTKEWHFDTPVYRHIYLYATWTGVATVNFGMNGHGTALDPIEVEMGSKIEKPADPTAEGYTFNGWYKENTCQTKWNFNDSVTDDMTLYAEWDVQQCRVSFDMMGHGLGPNPQIVNYGDQVAEPAPITIEGYTFEGWFKEITFENKWDFDNDFVNSETVLYAKWTSNSGGGGNGDSATVPVWVLTSVIAGSVVFVGAAILLLRRH